MVKIKLKWNKETFSDVTIDTAQNVAAFKETVYKLTAVPKDRQKLMAKGAWTGVLKEDTDLSSARIKEGQQVLLMGSAEVVAAPKEAVKFVEDMTVEEQALKGALIPAGLVNLGNTCYMNSTVECLRYMPELRQALNQAQSINLATLLRATYDELDKSGSSIPPYSFVHNLRTNFPQFAEQRQGRFMQQDAEEFYNALMGVIQREVDRTPIPFGTLLGMQMEEKLSCQECAEEPAVLRNENVNKLICNIQGGSGAQVNVDHMHEGLKLGLEGTVEKASTILDRDAVWNRQQRIAALPRYLCVQFMRFFWKPTPDNRDHAGLKCKILRSVSFPEVFDVFEFCAEELKAKLRANRDASEKKFEDELATKRAKIAEDSSPSGSGVSAVESKENSDGQKVEALAAAPTKELSEEEEEALALEQAMKMSLGDAEATPPEPPAASAETASGPMPPIAPTSAAGEKATNSSEPPVTTPVSSSSEPVDLGNGLPMGFTGHYELHAIVTHKGRSADSGHYIGWVRQAPGAAMWWCYNDDKVTEVASEEIMKLCGGGDRDMAYLNFYRYRE